MGRGRRNYSDHIVKLNAATHTVTIKPRYVDPRNHTIVFGLGDAVIQLNTKNLPKKIVMPITGESKGVGLLPPDPYKFRLLGSFAASFTKDTRTVEGFNKTKADVSYPRATSGFKARSADNNVDVALTGLGSKDIDYSERLSW